MSQLQKLEYHADYPRCPGGIMFAHDWHVWFSLVAVGVFAGILSYLGCRVALSIATRYGMIVQPGDRQSHAVATPTGGGLGIVFSLIVTTIGIHIYISLPLFWWLHMLPGIVILAVAGWFDDRHHISSLVRLLAQLVVSISISWVIIFSIKDGFAFRVR